MSESVNDSSDDSKEIHGESRPLIDVTAVPTTAAYLREVLRRREFAMVVPIQDLRAKNMDTVLGQLWHLINPALLVGIYYLIFGVVLETSRGVDNFLGFLLIGVVVFHSIQRVAQDAAVCITRHLGLIRSIQFPRILLPVSTVNGQTVAFLPSLIITLMVLIVTGERPSLRWFMLPLILIALFSFNLGSAMLIARIGRSVRDLQQLLPHLLRLVFYASGVIFNVDTFISNETWRRAFALNPVYGVITCARWCLMGIPVDPWVIAGLVVWAILFPVVAFKVFHHDEKKLGS